MTGIITNANQPKALTGIRDENPFDIKAKAVVELVAIKALYARLKVYAILLL